MRYLLEKATNFADLRRIICFSEQLKIDAAIDKSKFLQTNIETALLSKGDIKAKYNSSPNTLTYKLPFNNQSDYEKYARCSLLSLALFVLQNKKKFRYTVLEFLVNLLNQPNLLWKELLEHKQNTDDVKEDLAQILYLQIFYKEYLNNNQQESHLKGGIWVPQTPLLEEKESDLLLENIKKVYFMNCSLFACTVSDVMYNFSLGSFALHLEAYSCNLEFMEELKKAESQNLENRKLVNLMQLINNMFAKRNNGKGESSLSMLAFCALQNNWKDDLMALKSSCKDQFNCEFNTSLKSTLSDTKFVSQLYLTQKSIIDKFCTATVALVQNIAERLTSSAEILKGKGSEYLLNCCKLISINLQISSSIDTSLSMLVYMVTKMREILSHETFSSLVLLFNKFEEDKRNKKSKFKLGEGSLVLYNYYHKLDSELNEVLLKKFVKDEKEIDENKNQQWESLTEFLNEKHIYLLSSRFMDIYNQSHSEELKELQETQNQEHRIPKIPKGTRDCLPEQMAIRSNAIDMIKGIFYKHGAVEIDTPVFELKETLLGKYGEEGGKLIYDLKDQGGELQSLRYDLTVPFARYMATNNIKKIKRFSISKVYRRDQPMMNKGRFREFYQCDVDIAGDYKSMIPDAEILKIVCEILDNINVSKYTVKINHRKLLEAMIELSGAPLTKFRSICSSVDKQDKEPWEKVKEELVNEKGVSIEEANNLEKFVCNNAGDIDSLIEKCNSNNLFLENANASAALTDLKELGEYLKAFGVYNNITLDFSLARGLDYYTGVIYEAVLHGQQVGSIAGGGRYDELIGMFCGGKTKIPSVGVSIGIERIMILLEEKMKNQIRSNKTKVLVATIGKGMTEEKLKAGNLLWDNNIQTEFLYEAAPNPKKQQEYALENKIPFIVWLGENEIKERKVKVKNTYKKEEVDVAMDDMAIEIGKMVKGYDEDLLNGQVVFEEEGKKDGAKKKGK